MLVSKVSSRKSHFNLFYYLPLLWIVTGMFWSSNGDKTLVAFAVMAIIYSLIRWPRVFIDNLKECKWNKIIIICMMFALGSYLTHGFGSREMRALMVSGLFLLSLPSGLINRYFLRNLLLLAAVNCFLISLYFTHILPTPRDMWPVNAIPFGTYAALICIICLVFFSILSHKRGQYLMLGGFFLSLLATLLTQSRGVILALGIVLALIGFYFIFVDRRFTLKISILILLLSAIGLLFSAPILLERYQSTQQEIQTIREGHLDTSIGLRIQMYQKGLVIAKDAIWFGHGKTLQPYMDKLLEKHVISYNLHKYMSMNFHNGFIEKVVTSGIVGLLLMLMLLCYPIFVYWRKKNNLLFASSMVAILYIAANMTDTPFTNGQSFISYLVFIGLLLNCYRTENQ
ncbi:O-antigen ligase family protein [Vibrio metschnikovii]|uniref:O-antigen ligase family protein n=1 Tax=Vibrio metschnikovii TaxID=28172 RepID=UPI001C2FF2AD|nr:O-antigen ligase family protein [Vibrio metschnikovii]